MPTTIQNFANVALQRQFARDFFFRVKQISIPGMSLDGENELLYARTASLPGRTIENKTVNYSGQVFNIGGRAVYPNSDGYSIEFYHDQDLDIRTKMEKASRVAWNNEDTTGNMCMPGVDSYIVLDLLKLPCQRGNVDSGSSLEVFKSFKLVGVGIRDIGEIAYEIADGSGEVKTFPVTFSYHWYEDIS